MSDRLRAKSVVDLHLTPPVVICVECRGQHRADERHVGGLEGCPHWRWGGTARARYRHRSGRALLRCVCLSGGRPGNDDGRHCQTGQRSGPIRGGHHFPFWCAVSGTSFTIRMLVVDRSRVKRRAAFGHRLGSPGPSAAALRRAVAETTVIRTTRVVQTDSPTRPALSRDSLSCCSRSSFWLYYGQNAP